MYSAFDRLERAFLLLKVLKNSFSFESLKRNRINGANIADPKFSAKQMSRKTVLVKLQKTDYG